MFALLINASILILAAATFNKTGKTDVAELEQVHTFLAPLLGSAHRADAVRHRAAVLRAEFDRDGDAVGPDRDGRLSRYPPAALAAAAGDARIAIVPAAIVTIWYGEKATGAASDPEPGGAEPAAALRGGAAGDVHGRPPQDGRTGRAALGDGARASLVAAIIIALNVEAAGRFPIGAAMANAASPPRRDPAVGATAAPAAGSGPCSPSCASPRPSSRDRRRQGPCRRARAMWSRIMKVPSERAAWSGSKNE